MQSSFLTLSEGQIGFAVVLVIAVFYIGALLWSLRDRLRDGWAGQSIPAKLAWLIFAVIIGFFAIAFAVANSPAIAQRLPPGSQSARWIAIFVLILFPGLIFYLFIVTRSTSLLNAFVANLDRLGLLGWRMLGTAQGHVADPDRLGAAEQQKVESETSRQQRISSYFDRFQAIYGDLPPNFVKQVISSTRTKDPTERTVVTTEVKVTPNLIQSYFYPVYAVTILIGLCWFSALPPVGVVGKDMTALEALVPTVTVVSAAFLGAYVFSLNLLVWRFMRRDLGPNAYVAFCLRLILSLTAAWILPSIVAVLTADGVVATDGVADLKRNGTLVIAFAIGAFPAILWQFIVGAFKKLPWVDIALPNLKKGMPLSDLDGLSVWHEARLEEEDIENVPNMATSDVVDLMLSTRLPPHRIIDWVDQSILLTAIAADHPVDTALRRDGLRKHGIKSATALLVARHAKHLAADAKIKLSTDESVGLVAWITEIADAISTFPNLAPVMTWKGIDYAPRPMLGQGVALPGDRAPGLPSEIVIAPPDGTPPPQDGAAPRPGQGDPPPPAGS